MLLPILYLAGLPARPIASSEDSARVRYASDRPWSENPGRRGSWPPAPDDYLARIPVTPDPNRLQATVEVAFLPGETRKIVDVPTSLPIGKRLFLQDAALMAHLPKGQSVSLVIGYPLRLDSKNQAMIGLYSHGSTVQVEVTRDSADGSGHVTVTIDGDYQDPLAPPLPLLGE